MAIRSPRPAHPAARGAAVGAGLAILPALAAGLLLVAFGSRPDDASQPAVVRLEALVIGAIGGLLILGAGTGIGAIIGATYGTMRTWLTRVRTR